MAAADDVRNFETGENPKDPTGFEQGWFSPVRARKVLGNRVKKAPFIRKWAGGQTAASPMVQDKLTAVADAVGWRRTNPNTVGGVVPAVTDVGDKLLIQWEYFLLTADPKILAQAVANAKQFVNWPAGFEGAADFDRP